MACETSCGGAGADEAAGLDDRAMIDLQAKVAGATFDDAVELVEAKLGLMRKDDGTVGGVHDGTFEQGDMMSADCEKLASAPAAT